MFKTFVLQTMVPGAGLSAISPCPSPVPIQQKAEFIEEPADHEQCKWTQHNQRTRFNLLQNFEKIKKRNNRKNLQ